MFSRNLIVALVVVNVIWSVILLTTWQSSARAASNCNPADGLESGARSPAAGSSSLLSFLRPPKRHRVLPTQFVDVDQMAVESVSETEAAQGRTSARTSIRPNDQTPDSAGSGVSGSFAAALEAARHGSASRSRPRSTSSDAHAGADPGGAGSAGLPGSGSASARPVRVVLPDARPQRRTRPSESLTDPLSQTFTCASDLQRCLGKLDQCQQAAASPPASDTVWADTMPCVCPPASAPASAPDCTEAPPVAYPIVPPLPRAYHGRPQFCTEQQGNISQLVMLTYASKPSYQFCSFIESAIYNGYERVHVLGWEPQADERAREFYLGNKLVASLAFLESTPLPRDTVVLFTDSLDVLIQESPAAVLNKYRAAGRRLVIATEPDCWPPMLEQRYPVPDFPHAYRFANSGGWIGTLDAAKEFLRLASGDRPDFREHEIKRFGKEKKFEVEIAGPHDSPLPAVLRRNDQIIVGMLYSEGSLRGAALDWNATIFQSMQIHPAQRQQHVEIDYQAHKLRNVFSKHHPALIHFNGGAKERNDRDGFDFAQIEPQLWHMQAPVRARCGATARSQEAFERAFVFHDMDLRPVPVSYDDICGPGFSALQR